MPTSRNEKTRYEVTTHSSFDKINSFMRSMMLSSSHKFKSYSIQKCNNNIQWYVLTMEVKYDKNN